MSQLYTQELIDIKEKAKAEALSLGHKFVTAEHLLLAMVCTPCQAGQEFLRPRKIDEKFLRKKLANWFSIKSDTIDSEEIEESSYPIRTLRNFMAFSDAEVFASGYNKPVSSLHLLWAILNMERSEAAKALVKDAEEAKRWREDIEKSLTAPKAANSKVFAHKHSDWSDRLKECAANLRGKIVGHDEAIERITDTLTRSWAGFLGSGRPTASFLFIGPRGSGKQTIARNIARYLYEDAERMLILNLGEFTDDSSISKLQDILFLTLGRHFPFGVIFVEGIEQANVKALECVNQILEKGHIVNSDGKRIDFDDYIVVISLVVDAEFFKDESSVGLRKTNRGQPCSTQEQYEKQLMPDIESALRSDTGSLVDEIVFFPPLNHRDQNFLLESWTNELNSELNRQYGVKLQIEQSLYTHLIKHSEEMGCGIGSLRRCFNRELVSFAAQALLEGRIKRESSPVIAYENGAAVLKDAPSENSENND
ncbi:AAA family ATPase [bacterium]|nr:AAA family ATPase [bacterium]